MQPQPILLKLCYCGSEYGGWQIQRNATTVQEKLEEALRVYCGAPVRAYAASRTDSGVHALGQVVCVHPPKPCEPRRMLAALNALTPPDISIRDAVAVAHNFCPRKNNRGKTYRYRLIISRAPNPFERWRSWWLRTAPCLERAEDTAQLFLGTHDFSALRGKGCQAPSAVKTLEGITLSSAQNDCEKIVQISITGSGFLRNMVRILVGTLVDVGLGNVPHERVEAAFAAGNRADMGMTAPAHGLYLEAVHYNPDPFAHPQCSSAEG